LKKRTERVGQLLSVSARAAESLATERLEPLGLAPGLGRTERVGRVGTANADRARDGALDRTAMVYLIDELEGKKLVERVRNPGDRRSFSRPPDAKGRQEATQGRMRARRADGGATRTARGGGTPSLGRPPDQNRRSLGTAEHDAAVCGLARV